MLIKLLKDKSQADAARLFLVASSNRTRDSGHELEHRKFYLNMKKTC